MSFVFFNPNKKRSRADDCTVRAVSKALGIGWQEAYILLCAEGAVLWDMPSHNDAWRGVLLARGFRRHGIPDTCPDCYTVRDFARDHPRGTYVAAVQDHILAVVDGDWYDTSDSGDMIVLYYLKKGD